MRTFFAFCFAAVPLFAVPVLGDVQYGDVTSQIERLGNPYNTLYPDDPPAPIYARNIWDMQAFDGRLYLGAGNSANAGPAVNAGPLPIIAYDPASNRFHSEFVVDDEQIDRFHVLDGRLYVPGHDPTQSWKWGNYYRLEADGWRKYRNLPGGIHNYAMAVHDGTLFAALGTAEGAAVSVSQDDGHTWTNHPASGGRVYSLVECRNRLFAAGSFVTWTTDQLAHLPEDRREALRTHYGTPVSEWQADRFAARPDLGREVMFPDIGEAPAGTFFGKLVKPLVFNGAAVYIGARIHNDHQFLPVGLFAAHSLEADDVRVQRLLPGEEEDVPWDLLQRDDTLYVLTTHKLPCGHYRIRVVQTSDLRTWTPVLHFEAPTFARSFERIDDAFYFGLGVTVENPREYRACELHRDTGALLRFDPHRSDESLLLGNLGLPDAFTTYLLPLLDHRDDALRQAAGTALKAFWVHHEPLRPRDRRDFLARMVELFQARESASPEERQVAFQLLLLHVRARGARATDALLREGIKDPLPRIRAVATLIGTVGLGPESARTLIRRLGAQAEVHLQNAAFSEFVNRPSPAFPRGQDPEPFAPTHAIPLPREGWRFRRDPNVAFGYLREWFAPELDDRAWREVPIGDFWATFLDELYVGVGWYRLTLDVPNLPGMDALGLHFGGVDENAWVWVNGQYAGQHNLGPAGWDQPFQLDVTHLVRPGRSNQITVRVMNTVRNGGIWRPVELRVFRKPL